MLSLVVCEKPSAARTIASALGAAVKGDGYIEGNGYIVTWCFGHLLELAPPDAYGKQYSRWRYADLPIIPSNWKHIPLKDKEKQLTIIKGLTNRSDVETIVNACDAGREGELIFRLVYEYAKCTKPIKRLWISSMEDSAILDGFDSLADGEALDTVYAAASCRERADWIVGYNSTRLFTVLYGTSLNVGRVQSPTLAMLAGREKDISAFVKEPFYTPVIGLDGFMAAGEKTKDKADADSIAGSCNGKDAVVTDIERVTKTSAPPKLYDLTSLQRDANRLLGFTAQQTLDCIQVLYEMKAVSYPRTDARYITADMRETVMQIIGGIGFEPDIDRIIGKVSDHHAIIPTLESRSIDLLKLPNGEREIFGLIRKRLIAAVSPAHVYEAVTVTLECAGSKFTAKGKSVITPGWKTQCDDDDDNDDGSGDGDSNLPELSKGQVFEGISVSVKEGTTTPPKHFTEDTLLSAMEHAGEEDMSDDVERKGLGTPATRASVIERLIKSGYVERQKKNLLPTQKGNNLIAVLPPSLTSARLTAEWENRLREVESGTLDAGSFMDGIAEFMKSIVSGNSVPKTEHLTLFPGSSSNTSEKLGDCPRCGAPVRESKKGFFCDSRACGFKIWRDSKFWTVKKKPLTAAIVTALLRDGRIALTGLYSEKTGRDYSATVVLADTGDGFVNFRLEFDRR